MRATAGDARLAANKFNVLSEPAMILLITYTERNETTGRKETIVSDGIDLDTGRTVVLPQERPEQLGGVLDRDFREYVIRDKPGEMTIPSKTFSR
jgi:hypothetical protein